MRLRTESLLQLPNNCTAEMAFILFAFNLGLFKVYGLAVLMDILNRIYTVLLRKLRGGERIDYDRL